MIKKTCYLFLLFLSMTFILNDIGHTCTYNSGDLYGWSRIEGAGTHLFYIYLGTYNSQQEADNAICAKMDELDSKCGIGWGAASAIDNPSVRVWFRTAMDFNSIRVGPSGYIWDNYYAVWKTEGDVCYIKPDADTDGDGIPDKDDLDFLKTTDKGLGVDTDFRNTPCDQTR